MRLASGSYDAANYVDRASHYRDDRPSVMSRYSTRTLVRYLNRTALLDWFSPMWFKNGRTKALMSCGSKSKRPLESNDKQVTMVTLLIKT